MSNINVDYIYPFNFPGPINIPGHLIVGNTFSNSGETNSFVQGTNNYASSGSHAQGFGTKANGYASHSEGHDTTTNGIYVHTEGWGTIGNGNYSHAEGNLTITNGQVSHAEGMQTQANGYASHAEGRAVQADGSYSHAEGYATSSDGQYSHAEGRQTLAIGVGSHAEGNGYNLEGTTGVTAIGDYSHAEGYSTRTFGESSHAEGAYAVAIGYASHAEGKGNFAKGNTATGEGSHAEGWGTNSIGEGSHAEGQDTQSIGDYSHAEGYFTQSIGDFSHAGGFNTIAGGLFSTVVGKNNVSGTTQGEFIIGNGPSSINRSNLLVASGNEVEIFGNTKTETIQVTDGATAGYVLTSDASGNGTWQSVGAFSDTFVTGSSLSGTTLLIDRNQGEPQISVDLSSLADDTIVNGFTYSNNNLTISQNGQSDLTTNIGVMTGVTVNGPADFTDEVLINSTTLFGQTTWNPTGVSRASHRIDGIVTPTLSDGTDGQLLHIYVADVLSAGSSTVTVTTSLGFNTIAFNALGDSVTLMFNQTLGWTIVGSYNVVIS